MVERSKGAGRKATRMVLQCINGVGSNSRRGKNKKLTALKSNSNTVWFNFQTYIYIIQYYRDCGSYQDVLDSLMVSAVIETT